MADNNAGLRNRQSPTVHGDGGQSRAFTYIDDVVPANQAAAAAPAEACHGQIYNVAGDRSYSLLDLLDALGRIIGVVPEPVHTAPRSGDIQQLGRRRHGANCLGFEPQIGFEDCLRLAVEWFERRAQPKEAQWV